MDFFFFFFSKVTTENGKFANLLACVYKCLTIGKPTRGKKDIMKLFASTITLQRKREKLSVNE